MSVDSIAGALVIAGACGLLWRAIRRLERIEENMATKDDLDAALATLGTTLQTATTDITGAFAALEAKIEAGASGPDLAPEVAQVNAAIEGLKGIDASALAANPPTSAADPATLPAA